MLEMLLNVKVSIHRIFRTDLTVLIREKLFAMMYWTMDMCTKVLEVYNSHCSFSGLKSNFAYL